MRTILALAALVLAPGLGTAQPFSVNDQRSSPKVLQTFRAVVAQPSASTVRVRVDGKDAALGAIVDGDGWVLTKASELQGKELVCKLKDGKELKAQVVGVHEPYDLAMLKVDAKGLPALAWRPAKEARVGQWVASPTPATFEPAAVGVVSVGPRKYRAGDQPPKNARSGFLGVSLDVTENGARIAGIQPDGPAARAKLRIGDIVIEAGGKKVLDNESLINAVQSHHPGEELTLRIRRGSEELELRATLGRLPPNFTNPQERMGSQLSMRRGGFPTILQHDSVLRPSDCGGPLVDLDGLCVGINIARAGRTETYAVPSDDVLALLPDLKSGKLAPTVEVTGPLSPRPRKLDRNVLLHDVNRLTPQNSSPRARPGRHSRVYTLQLALGEEVEVDLESIDFDAYLILEDSTGKKLAENDDVERGDLNARIRFRAPRDDGYRIIVTTEALGETGAFELTVRKK